MVALFISSQIRHFILKLGLYDMCTPTLFCFLFFVLHTYIIHPLTSLSPIPKLPNIFDVEFRICFVEFVLNCAHQTTMWVLI